MKCKVCGFEFEEGIFCPECGTKIDIEEVISISKETNTENSNNSDVSSEDNLNLNKDGGEDALLEPQSKNEKNDSLSNIYTSGSFAQDLKDTPNEEKDLKEEKYKLEQEKIAAEKLAHEAELLKQKNENIRLQREEEERKRALEEERLERESRTFDGITYNSIEEKNKAIEAYEEKAKRTINGVTYNTIEEALEAKKVIMDKEAEMEVKIGKYNILSIWSLVLSIVSVPLLFTCFLWIPSTVVSIVLGIKALNLRTPYKAKIIISMVFNGIVILIGVFILLSMLMGVIAPELVKYIDKVNGVIF